MRNIGATRLAAMGINDLDGVSLLHAHSFALAARNENKVVRLWLALDHSGCSCADAEPSCNNSEDI